MVAGVAMTIGPAEAAIELSQRTRLHSRNTADARRRTRGVLSGSNHVQGRLQVQGALQGSTEALWGQGSQHSVTRNGGEVSVTAVPATRTWRLAQTRLAPGHEAGSGGGSDVRKVSKVGGPSPRLHISRQGSVDISTAGGYELHIGRSRW